MGFLRRAPSSTQDKFRIELGTDINISAFTGLSNSSGNGNVFLLTDGTMDALIYKNGSLSGSGTFTGRKWRYNSRSTSEYYARVTNITYDIGSGVTLAQSSGTIGNWTQISSALNWGISVAGSDEGVNFTLQISNSASGTRILDSVNARIALAYTGSGGGGTN
mgnify:CR=1 FL=1